MSEYSITEGRIDTLGIDENNCPVIVNTNAIRNEKNTNQGLYYLDWLMDYQDLSNCW